MPTDSFDDIQSADILCVPGGLSSIDVFALLSAIQGEDYTKLIQLEYEYDPVIPLGGGIPETADTHILI
ncbi:MULTISPECIES: hypothetical protein [Xenorhabdus]|uniref:hypothetical protein n=1 Tax=Xenorhabdus TaxID=626 RepID=UPI0012E02B82|nr:MULTISPECIES: hypothetical protein [Xenorhabdus]